MKYRSGMDIAAATLGAMESGANKTRTMQRAMLSFPQLKEYLQILKEAGTIEMRGREGRTIYFASERVRIFLKVYIEIDKMVPRTNMPTKAT